MNRRGIMPGGLAAWWMQRSGRERLLLLILGAGLAAYLVVVAVAQPLLAARDAALTRIGSHEVALAQLAALPEGGVAPRPADSRPVPAIVTETAPAFDLAIRRIEPEGNGARLVIEDAGFAEILTWIEALEREHGLRLAAIEIDRRPEPGIVSARLTLER